LADTIAAIGGTPAMDKVLGVASVHACYRVGAVDNFQARDVHCSFDEFLVGWDEVLHRSEAFFRVIRWREKLIFVSEVIF
jgi:hypothetical protein